MCCFFFFNDTATTEIYTLSLHDALPIWADRVAGAPVIRQVLGVGRARHDGPMARPGVECLQKAPGDPHALAPRYLEDGVLRRESYDAVPGPPPETAAHVLFQTGPRPRQGIAGWLHGCNLNAPGEAVN